MVLTATPNYEELKIADKDVFKSKKKKGKACYKMKKEN